MDIAQALANTAQAVEEDPLMLLSLYTFITQAKATEVSQTSASTTRPWPNAGPTPAICWPRRWRSTGPPVSH